MDSTGELLEVGIPTPRLWRDTHRHSLVRTWRCSSSSSTDEGLAAEIRRNGYVQCVGHVHANSQSVALCSRVTNPFKRTTMPNKFAKETLVFAQQANTLAAAEAALKLPEDVAEESLQTLRAWGIAHMAQRGAKTQALRVTGAFADEVNAISAAEEHEEMVRAEAEAKVAQSLDAISSNRQRVAAALKLSRAQRAVPRAGVVGKPAPKAVSDQKRGAKRIRTGVNAILKAGAKALSEGYRYAHAAEKAHVVALYKEAKKNLAVISQYTKGQETSTMDEWIANLIDKYAQPSEGRKKRVRMSKSSIYNWVKADQVRSAGSDEQDACRWREEKEGRGGGGEENSQAAAGGGAACGAAGARGWRR